MGLSTGRGGNPSCRSATLAAKELSRWQSNKGGGYNRQYLYMVKFHCGMTTIGGIQLVHQFRHCERVRTTTV